ncbi:MAG: phosphatidate cytidylyltransferase [Firmicutes bacterium]|nr:phosphatidate cytidylyltransferase [Bacillota bacterium]
MLQRIVTGVVSAALLMLVMFFRGWVIDIAIVLVTMLGCHEMHKAFLQAGLHPARGTVFGMALLMLPLYQLVGIVGIYLLGCSATLIIILQISLRKQPRWVDAAASLSVLVCVPVPLSMLYPILRIQPDMLGAVFVFLVFAIALLGDTFAYFVGVTLGKHPMAPEVSPKKTWEGAAAGLLGSVAGAVVVGMSGVALTPMPPLWHFLVLGLVGGTAGQLGDLSASLMKRFCGIKDFGTMFPGHGGMMDRFDSIIFVSYVLFGYCMVAKLF